MDKLEVPEKAGKLSRRGMLLAGGRAAAVIGAAATLGVVTANSATATQDLWAYCANCSGLWFAGGNDNGACPNGGPHSAVDSGNYNLKFASDLGAGQIGWRYCHQCNGLWFSGGGGTGECAGSSFFGHSKTGSGDYKLESAAAAGVGQTGWRYCFKCLGLWFSLSGSHVCPDGGSHSQSGSGDYKLRRL